jgi:hypothetical protein
LPFSFLEEAEGKTVKNNPYRGKAIQNNITDVMAQFLKMSFRMCCKFVILEGRRESRPVTTKHGRFLLPFDSNHL